jgi:uncharacterized damage-inducible protein DinB
MENGSQLAKRLREAILNGTWIANTNYKDQLTGLDWQTATLSMNGSNSIALLAQHIHYYIDGINSVFKGGPLTIKDKYSFDFPPIASQVSWETFLQKLWDDTEAFATFVEQMPEEKLGQVFVDEKYGTFRRNIEAMIEHSYYHLGQIVLIKKILLKDR